MFVNYFRFSECAPRQWLTGRNNNLYHQTRTLVYTFTFTSLWVSAVLVNVCGRERRRDRLKSRWCGAVDAWTECVHTLWAVSTGCPWPVESEAGGRRGERGEASVWAGWQLSLSLSLSSLSGLRGAPRVKTLPLAASFVSSISGIQTQLCTRMHKHANGRTLTCSHKYPWKTASSLEHTHTHTLSRLRQVFMLS